MRLSRHSSDPATEASLPRVALLGNPNSGKTSLFNALTGLRYKVGNYPGVTVERREGKTSLAGRTFIVADLPGIYCLEDHSADERVTVGALQGEWGDRAPDVVLLVVDATMLERGLYLAAEVIERKLPIVVVLTMMDLLAKRGERIRVPLLQQRLGMPVVPLRANRARESFDAMGKAVEKALEQRGSPITSALGGYTPKRAAPGSSSDTDDSSARYAKISALLDGCIVGAEYRAGEDTDRLDAILTHSVWGMVFFVAVMSLLFQAVFSFASLPMDWIEAAVSWCGVVVSDLLPEGLFRSLVVDGIIAGLGSVLVFLPQIGLLFFLLSLLEESGYLVRAAFLMDSVLRRVGLQGRSFIPLLSSFACAIPGIMSTRVIGSSADRLLTILVAPLMSCSARLPVYTLLISAFFADRYLGGVISLRGLILFSLYALGIAGAALVAFVMSRFVMREEPSVFVMEMPTMRRPSLRAASVSAFDRVLVFLRSTGPVIMASSVLLWALASFPRGPIQQTYAGMFGRLVEPLFAPLGFSWEVCIAIVCSFAAREIFVSALGTILNVSSGESDAQTIASLLREQGVLSFPAGIAALVFFVFACQCMSTLAVVRRETGSWRWPAFQFVYMMALAWTGAWMAYRVTSWWIG